MAKIYSHLCYERISDSTKKRRYAIARMVRVFLQTVGTIAEFIRKSCRLYHKKGIYKEIPDEFSVVDWTCVVVSAGSVVLYAVYSIFLIWNV
ncbi:unnamed protein product [Larinioides sclopetarius]|uniref:Gustatory receptor n=1 Tax=Larinioides sclopetarius TaxID=280406 RepID=A0AAV1ZWS2_9ARAC